MNENIDLPSGWTTAPLKDVSEKVIDGSHNPPPKQDSGIPMLSARNIGMGTIEFSDFRCISQEAFEAENKRADLRPGDVLLTIVGTIGRAAVIPDSAKPFALQRSVAMIRAKELDSKFLMYQLLSETVQKWLRAHARGSAQQGVYLKTLGSLPTLIAPLDEQRRIVAEIEKQFTRLDVGVAALLRTHANLKRYRSGVLKAACEGRLVPTEAELARNAGRRNAGRNYESAEELLYRILTERRTQWNGRGEYAEPAPPNTPDLSELPEGWVWCSSDMLLSFVTSGSRGWARYYSESGPLFLRIANLEHEDIRLDLRKLQFVKPPPGAEGVRTSVEPNDLLISITADVGMVGLVPEGLGEAYINQHIALARPVEFISPPYLAYYLCASEGGWGRFKKLQRGATKVGLGLDDIRSVAVPLPPLAEQERIVAEVDRRLSLVEELEATVTANLQRAARLRQAVLQQAFSGSLVPQDPNDEPVETLLNRIKKQVSVSTSAKTPLGRKTKKMPSKPVNSLEELLDRLDNLGGAVEPERLFAASQLSALEDGADKFFEWLRQGRDKGILIVPVGESGTIRRSSNED